MKLNPKAEKWVKSGHPWIFEESIQKASGSPKTGDVAVIFDQWKNRFLACGFWDAESPIRIKLCQFEKSAQLNEEWFIARLEEAYSLRTPLFETDTNAYRLIFGENDRFPGLICDVYDDVAVVKIYSGIWWRRIEIMADLIRDRVNARAVILRIARRVKAPGNYSDGMILLGELNNPEIIFREFGIRFMAHVIKGHKTGYFLDHRSNRKRVGDIASGKTVLDVFSYAGGFSVHALVGGAREVTSVDVSQQALELAKRNADLNEYSGKHLTICGDAFEVLQNIVAEGRQYDIVVIDPPSFAKRASEVEGAKKAYRRLVKLGSQLVSKGGILVMASCSSRISPKDFFSLVDDELRKGNSDFRLLSHWGHDVDHPVVFPEGEYLKCGFWEKDDSLN